MNTSVKLLTNDDWKIYKELRMQMLTEEPQAYSQTIEELSDRTDEEWKEKTATYTLRVLVIYLDSKVVGMNGLFYENKVTVSIWGMFIRKEFTRKGLAEKLMIEIEKEIMKNPTVKSIQISVMSSQIPAWELYKKLGFKEVKRINGRKKINDQILDEIVLKKSISNQ